MYIYTNTYLCTYINIISTYDICTFTHIVCTYTHNAHIHIICEHIYIDVDIYIHYIRPYIRIYVRTCVYEHLYITYVYIHAINVHIY